MKTILCYGDSNTYGYDPRSGSRYPKEIRWTTILQAKLGNEYEVVPEGLNGRTTAYDRSDGDFLNGLTYLSTCLHTHKPLDYIVFMLGTNDCNVDLDLSSKDIALGMEKLILKTKDVIKEMQDYDSKIIVIVPASIGPNYENSIFAYQLDEQSVIKSKEIKYLYKDLCNKYDCVYLDCSDLKVSDIDSEHLTIEAHSELANRLYSVLLDKQ